MLCEMSIYKLYFNNTFQEAEKTNKQEKQEIVSYFVRKKEIFLEVYLLC